MNDGLAGREIEAAVAQLMEIETAVASDVAAGAGGKLSPNSADALRRTTGVRTELEECLQLLRAREAAAAYLAGLEAQADASSGEVPYGGGRLPFDVARVLGVQAYLGVTWSIADKVACVSAGFFAKNSKPVVRREINILKTFMAENGVVPACVCHPLRAGFGWPTALAYAARNHFLHDGGGQDGWVFFSGTAPEAGFTISQKGGEYMERRYCRQEMGLDDTMTRAPEAWPWHQDDFRRLMSVCVREMDVALGIIVGLGPVFLKAYTVRLLE